MLKILKTAGEVAEKSCLVWIDKQVLVSFVRNLIANQIEVPSWNRSYHFEGGNEDTVTYFLVLDSINFCFWPPPGKERWKIEYDKDRVSGYYALAASLKLAIESGVSITSADYLSKITLDELREVLGGRGELQLLEERVKILNELGKVLLEKYAGRAGTLLESAEKSALALVRRVVENFPSFRDRAEYRGHEVLFHKRAQILAADLFGAFGGRGWGSFTDIDQLTCFADYKLPQVLRYLGILHYRPSLSRKVDHKILIEPGSPEEVEIRANTIFAVELIRQELAKVGEKLRSFEIDWILWQMGQDNSLKLKPYHRTLTTFY